MRGRLRTFAVAGAYPRTWFMYWLVHSCSKNSTACAGQPVMLPASSSSISAVPLRRRYMIVLPTSARGELMPGRKVGASSRIGR